MPEDKPTHPAFQAMAQPMRAENQQQAAAAAPPPPAPTPESAQRVQSATARKFNDPVDVILRSGKKVVLGEPPAATQFETYKILEALGSATNEMSRLTVKALMYVRSVDGRQVTRPDDLVQARILMNELGDDGVETVTASYLQFFALYGVKLPL